MTIEHKDFEQFIKLDTPCIRMMELYLRVRHEMSEQEREIWIDLIRDMAKPVMFFDPKKPGVMG